MRSRVRFLTLVALALSSAWTASSWAAEAPPLAATATKNKVKVELAADVTAIAPGETFRLGVFIRPDPEWHVYWKFAGDTGLPTEVRWVPWDGLDFGAIAWPVPQRLPDKIGGRAFGYGEVLLVSEVRLPETTLEGTEVPLEAKVEWLVCKENCIQGSAKVGLRLPVHDTPRAERASSAAKAFDAWALKVPLAEPPAGVSVKAEVSGGPVAPGGAFSATLTLTGDGPMTAVEPAVEAYFPASEVLEVTAIEKRPSPDDKTVVLALVGKATARPDLGSRLEGVVRLVKDGKPLAFDVHFDVPRQAGPPGAGSPGSPGSVVEQPAQHDTIHKGNVGAAGHSLGPAPGGDPCAGADVGARDDGQLSSFVLALFFAFLGGIILNAMPCVLPVLSLKVLGLVEQSQETPQVIWRHGLIYTAGVLASFLVFAIILIALQQSSWAFQFQDPTFVAIFTAVVFAFGLSLFGVFEVTLPWVHHVDAMVSQSHGYTSSFNYGVFAVLLGTPCTAPFLGPALAYAFTRPPFEMTLLLLMVGLGLAFPFLLLARFPGWRRILPKPGPWLVTFKKVMGFFLVGTAVFMLSIFAAQVSREALVSYLVFLAVLSFALFVYGHWTSPMRRTSTRLVATAVAGGLAVGAALLFVSTEPPPPMPGSQVIAGVTWHDFDQVDVEQHARDGRLVFVDFTANWCATCKVNEATAIHTEATRHLFERLDVLTVKGDFTVHKPAIAQWLERFNEPSVPLYVVIPAGRPSEAFKLAPLISEGDVRDGVCRAFRATL